MKRKLRLALYALGDRICARAGAGTDAGVTRPVLFAAGDAVAEAGWRLR